MENKTATARAWNLNISPKYSREIATNIRELSVIKALRLLDEVVEMRRPIILRKHNAEVPHHYGRPGRYPVKAVKEFILIIHNAIANAGYIGLDESKLMFDRLEASRGRVKKPWGGKAIGKSKKRGRRTNIVVVLTEGGKKK